MELDADAIRATERERLRALVQVDLDSAAALHADDYQLITPRGYPMSKQDYLSRIASGRLRYRVFEPVSEIAVRGSAEVALLRYQARISVAENEDGDAGTAGDDAVITCWHTDCYEWRDDRWQAVWSQATVIRPELSRLGYPAWVIPPGRSARWRPARSGRTRCRARTD